MCFEIPSKIQLTNTDQEVVVEEVASENHYENKPNECGEDEDEMEVVELEYLKRMEVIQDMMSITEFLNPMQVEVTDSPEDFKVQV
jgi:hypothetical protein